MKINANKYKANEILRCMREATNLTQTEFAKTINKSRDWQQSNEYGRSNYYFKDLIEIANKLGFEIEITKK